MQHDVVEHLKEQIEDSTPDHYGDFGFNLPYREVLETCGIWYTTNFVVMPDPGGWKQQSKLWKQDAMTYLRVRAYLANLYQELKKSQSKNEGFFG